MVPSSAVCWWPHRCSVGRMAYMISVVASLPRPQRSGMSQQKMHAVLLGLVVTTLTSGRLRTLFHLLFSWSVDPDLGVEGGWGWNLSHKSLGVVLIGIAQYLGSSFGDDLCVAFMDVSGRHESKADMVVFVLVPGEELRKEGSRLVEAPCVFSPTLPPILAETCHLLSLKSATP